MKFCNSIETESSLFIAIFLLSVIIIGSEIQDYVRYCTVYFIIE